MPWWQTNPAYVWEKRRRGMRRARIAAGLGLLPAVVAAEVLICRQDDWGALGFLALLFLTSAPQDALLVVSGSRDQRSGALDQLRLTATSMAEIMRAKLLASFLPLLPVYTAAVSAAGLIIVFLYDDPKVARWVVGWLLANSLLTRAWAVRSSLLSTRWGPWAPLVLYGVLAALSVGAPVAILLFEAPYVVASFILDYPWAFVGLILVASLMAWAYAWRSVRRFEW